MSERPSRDLPRQVWVTAAFLVGLVGVLFGTGVLGTRVEESPGGDLAADATLLAPASSAFAIWGLIYLLLTAYVIYQWLPAQRTDRRHQAIGWLAGWTLLLNGVWLLVTQRGWIWASVLVILALAAVLATLVFRMHAIPSFGMSETVAVDVAFGLYLGWVVVASGANIGAALASSGWGPGRWLSIALLLVVTVVGMALLRLLSGRVAVAAALTWGLAWICYGRLAGDPRDALVGLVAGGCAITVLAVGWGSQGRSEVISDSVAL